MRWSPCNVQRGAWLCWATRVDWPRALTALNAAAADCGTVLYNLLLDGDHAYWVVQDAVTPLLQSISHTAEGAAGSDKAFLVHNKGG